MSVALVTYEKAALREFNHRKPEFVAFFREVIEQWEIFQD